MRHLLQWTWGALLLSALAFAPSTALAAASDGWHHNDIACEGTADTTVPNLDPMKTASWCPITTTTKIIKVTAIADCNWTDSGGATLSIDQCSGSTSATCTTPLWDSDTNAAWVVTSGGKNGRFSLGSGYHEITASGVAASGVLVCTGRQ